MNFGYWPRFSLARNTRALHSAGALIAALAAENQEPHCGAGIFEDSEFFPGSQMEAHSERMRCEARAECRPFSNAALKI
jgi:hypothetical protein